MNSYDQFIQNSQEARRQIDLRIRELIPESPKSLYDPIRNALESGGKRLRPVLTYLASFSASDANWLPAACAVELLHTFTLVHDDIMDNASTRRGAPTLHKKYNLSTAILAGDAIIALAEESLASGKYELADEMMSEFAYGFRSVCEGQAYDKEFEVRADVSVDEYIQMIDLKSAKMLELAAVLGDYAAGGENIEALREFAHHTGIAFQIRDDLLDLTADEATFGKTIGGDILEGKRTFLFVTAAQMFDSLPEKGQALMLKIGAREAEKSDIALVKKLFSEHDVIRQAEDRIEGETIVARNCLEKIANDEMKKGLLEFSQYLLGRTY
jgi:geranylgeranyl diphosphate synthase type II